MSGSKQDTETVHALFQDMRACRLGDPIIVASVVRRVPSVQLRNACRARADRALPSELRLQLINPSTSPNELNTTLTQHSMIHGDACFPYFNKIWGIP